MITRCGRHILGKWFCIHPQAGTIIVLRWRFSTWDNNLYQRRTRRGRHTHLSLFILIVKFVPAIANLYYSSAVISNLQEWFWVINRVKKDVMQSISNSDLTVNISRRNKHCGNINWFVAGSTDGLTSIQPLDPKYNSQLAPFLATRCGSVRFPSLPILLVHPKRKFTYSNPDHISSDDDHRHRNEAIYYAILCSSTKNNNKRKRLYKQGEGGRPPIGSVIVLYYARLEESVGLIRRTQSGHPRRTILFKW